MRINRTNSEYERKINALIPRATQMANQKVPQRGATHANAWSRAFHLSMDELARRAGLRTSSYQVDPFYLAS